MQHLTEPRLLYWRIFLVGCGTVFATAVTISTMLVIRDGDLRFLPMVTGYSLAFGAIISAVFAIPMLVIWVPIFSVFRNKVHSIRMAAVLTSSILAAVGTILLAGIFELTVQGGLEVWISLLILLPVSMAIAAGLAFYFSDPTEFQGFR